MSLVEHDDVVETLAAHRADHAFDIRILPRGARRGPDIRQADRRDRPSEGVIEDRVAIVQEKARRHLPRKGFSQLPARPRQCRVRRHVDVQYAPARVGEDDEDEQHATGEGRHREQVERDERAGVILEEGAPCLEGRPTPTGHQPGHRSLGYGKTELDEFAVDAWRPPTTGWPGHLADEAAQLAIHTGAAAGRTRPPGPVPGEPASMPGDDRRGPDDHQRRSPVRPRAAQADLEESVGPADRGSRSSAPVHGQLLPEGEVLEREGSVPAREDGELPKDAKQAGEHDPG